MNLFSFFFRSYPSRTILVFIGITIASIITAVTLLALPALLFSLLGRNSAKTQFVNDFLLSINIEPTPENLIIFLLAGITLQNILLAGSNIYAGFTKAKIVKDLRLQFLRATTASEWRFFLKQKNGVFTTALTSEIDKAGNGYGNMVLIMATFAQIIAYLSVAFFIAWQIAVLAIVTSLILTALFSRLIKASKEFGKEESGLTRKITAQLTDSYRSIKPLKAMAREKYSYEVITDFTRAIKKITRKNTITSEFLDAVQEIVLMATVILTIYFSFQYLNLPFEYSIILVILYLRSMKLFGKSQKQLQNYAGNQGAFELTEKFLDEAIAHKEFRPGKINHKLNGDIEFRNVSFSHSEKEVLKNTNATFYFHKLNSVIGPSGQGKTTTADLICGLFEPDKGRIIVDDIELDKISIKHWRSQIGYVTQENTLLDTSIRENITLGDPDFTDEDVLHALERAQCLEFVSELSDGIDSLVGENGGQLSGGQCQRILIARALVHSPNLLILDEATSALDMETEKSLSKIFREISRETTVISISHRPAMMEVSDNILLINDKKLQTYSPNSLRD
jgi:ATP-binding cassette subfamily C protein